MKPVLLARGRGRGNLATFANSFRPKTLTRRNPDVGIQLSPSQKAAADKLLSIMLKKAKGNTPSDRLTIAVLAGAAGTGKTTLMRYVMEQLVRAGMEPMLLAPTGKAAARLRDLTGAQTATIHSGLLSAPSEQRMCPKCGGWSSNLGINPAIAARKGLTMARCEKCNANLPVASLAALPQRLGFEVGEGERPSVYIVDESSMISRALMDQIQDAAPADASILFVGDREQLQPVVGYGEPPGWGVNFDQPDAVLTEVMRQAAGNPIVQLATAIRNGQQGTNYFRWQTDPNDLRLVIQPARNYESAVRDYFQHRAARIDRNTPNREKNDVVMLTYTNGTRQLLNDMARNLTGRAEVAARDGTFLATADRIVITMNNRSLGLYNGEVFSVRSVEYVDDDARRLGLIKVTLITQTGDRVVWTRGDALGMPATVYKAAFENLVERFRDVVYEVAEMLNIDNVHSSILKYVDDDLLWRLVGTVRPIRLTQMDFGECITINKSQGSQWRNVIIVWDGACGAMAKRDPELARRYAYTALTRASDTAHVYLVDAWGGQDRTKDIGRGYGTLPQWVFAPLPPLRPGAVAELVRVARAEIDRGAAEMED